jgi:ubiquitin
MEILYEEEGNGYIGLSWEDNLKVWILHIVCKEWSLSTYKRYKKIGERIKDILRSRGIYEIYGLSDTKKEVKFNILFGGQLTDMVVETDEGVRKYLVKGVL